jgi:hypothetical protein
MKRSVVPAGSGIALNNTLSIDTKLSDASVSTARLKGTLETTPPKNPLPALPNVALDPTSVAPEYNAIFNCPGKSAPTLVIGDENKSVTRPFGFEKVGRPTPSTYNELTSVVSSPSVKVTPHPAYCVVRVVPSGTSVNVICD